jgi:hypothetical protein
MDNLNIFIVVTFGILTSIFHLLDMDGFQRSKGLGGTSTTYANLLDFIILQFCLFSHFPRQAQQPSTAAPQKQQCPPPPAATEFGSSSSFVAPHLAARLADPGQQRQLNSSTIWQLLQRDCFRHLRALFLDGITKL